MMNMDIRDFANRVALLLPDTHKRRIVLPALLGMAIGSFLQVKQEADLSPVTAFNSAHTANVGRAVSFLNEEIMIDVQAAIEAAKSMYLVRSRILSGQPCDYSINPEFDIMAIALGMSAVVPVEVYNVMKETGLSASKVYNLATLMIGNLKKSGAIDL
jgi:hypothetical protein